MMVLARALFITLAGSVAAMPAPVQSPRPADCAEWRQCRQMALDAAERGDYEAFHDLAWRTIQKGNPKDPALMYLLARAQALSGRPHDALVMLQRLAEMGVPSDAATSEDFKRARDLPGWPELVARFERIGQPGAAPAVAATSPSPAAPVAAPSPSPAPSVASTPSTPPSAAPSAAPAVRSAPPARPATPPAARESASVVRPAAPPVAAPVVRTPPLFTPAPIAEAGRFSTAPFAVSGLAYDVSSRRFLLGDRRGRKLIVVGDGSNRMSDLVHGDSAGFREISAIEIDAKRGDLWVATSAAGGGAGTLHRLQLISGRPLRAFPLDRPPDSASLVDLAVTPTGTVLVLDASGPELFALGVGKTSLESIARIGADEPTSVAASDRDGVAYVAHREGVSRIDLRSHSVTSVPMPKGTSIGRLERMRWYRNALIVLTRDDDDTRRIVRLELNAGGTSVARAITLAEPVPSGVQSFVTISGDDLLYVESASGASSDLTELVVYRVRLR